MSSPSLPSWVDTSVLNGPVQLCSCHVHLHSSYVAMLAQYRRPDVEFQLGDGYVVLHRWGCRCFWFDSPPTFPDFAHGGVRVRLLNRAEAEALIGTYNGRRARANVFRWSKSCCRHMVTS